MRRDMPEKGRDFGSIKAEMIARGQRDVRWREGKTAVYVFHAGDDVLEVQKQGYLLYMSENG